MDTAAVVVLSSSIAAIVGAGATYVSQHALAARQARISYQYAARARLYEALGPLRFQLLMASRDVVRRVIGHAPPSTWNLDTAQPYGQSTLYRLLRPLAICILIERQMNAADFSVDPSGVRLLRFEVSAYRMLTNSDPLDYHSDLDWENETQHVFRDNLRSAADQLIQTDGDTQRVMDFAEFRHTYASPMTIEPLASLAGIIEACGTSLADNPVFWTRLVGYAYLCQQFIDTTGTELGFTRRPVDVAALLATVDDPDIARQIGGQQAIFQAIVDEGL